MIGWALAHAALVCQVKSSARAEDPPHGLKPILHTFSFRLGATPKRSPSWAFGAPQEDENGVCRVSFAQVSILAGLGTVCAVFHPAYFQKSLSVLSVCDGARSNTFGRATQRLPRLFVKTHHPCLPGRWRPSGSGRSGPSRPIRSGKRSRLPRASAAEAERSRPCRSRLGRRPRGPRLAARPIGEPLRRARACYRSSPKTTVRASKTGPSWQQSW
jgi:hypothetical protein